MIHGLFPEEPGRVWALGLSLTGSSWQMPIIQALFRSANSLSVNVIASTLRNHPQEMGQQGCGFLIMSHKLSKSQTLPSSPPQPVLLPTLTLGPRRTRRFSPWTLSTHHELSHLRAARSVCDTLPTFFTSSHLGLNTTQILHLAEPYTPVLHASNLNEQHSLSTCHTPHTLLSSLHGSSQYESILKGRFSHPTILPLKKLNHSNAPTAEQKVLQVGYDPGRLRSGSVSSPSPVFTITTNTYWALTVYLHSSKTLAYTFSLNFHKSYKI